MMAQIVFLLLRFMSLRDLDLDLLRVIPDTFPLMTYLW